jgi:hypothetical protein
LSATCRWALAVTLGSLLMMGATAHAEVWGYVDGKGRKHFADHQVNRHYRLLFQTPGSPVTAVHQARSRAASLHTAFEISVGYKAVKHLIREAAAASGVEYDLLKAVISTESNFNARAVSPMGAVGLMQVIPETAERFGVSPSGRQTVGQRLIDPRTNLQAGARYLAWLLKRFDGEIPLALAAYNAGEGAVDRAGRQIPNYPETQNYVRKVMRLHQDLRPQQPSRSQRTITQQARVEDTTAPPAAVIASN